MNLPRMRSAKIRGKFLELQCHSKESFSVDRWVVKHPFLVPHMGCIEQLFELRDGFEVVKFMPMRRRRSAALPR